MGKEYNGNKIEERFVEEAMFRNSQGNWNKKYWNKNCLLYIVPCWLKNINRNEGEECIQILLKLMALVVNNACKLKFVPEPQ